MGLEVSKGIDDGGGYDLKEIQSAREGLKVKKVGEGVPKEVDPIYIDVKDGVVARSKELGQREVFIDYDEYGNIIGVDIL